MPRSRSAWLGPAAVTLGVVALDQLSKWLVRRGAASLPFDLAAGVRLEITMNSGISFSRFSDAGWPIVALVGLLCVALAAAFVLAPVRYRYAIAVMLGGAVGNFIDRLRFDGAVLDFIASRWWPTFNVADVAIVAGVLLVVLQVFRAARD